MTKGKISPVPIYRYQLMNWIPKTRMKLIERTLAANPKLTFGEESTCLKFNKEIRLTVQFGRRI